MKLKCPSCRVEREERSRQIDDSNGWIEGIDDSNSDGWIEGIDDSGSHSGSNFESGWIDLGIGSGSDSDSDSKLLRLCDSLIGSDSGSDSDSESIQVAPIIDSDSQLHQSNFDDFDGFANVSFLDHSDWNFSEI